MIQTVLIYICWKVDVCRIKNKEDMDKRIQGALAFRVSVLSSVNFFISARPMSLYPHWAYKTPQRRREILSST